MSERNGWVKIVIFIAAVAFVILIFSTFGCGGKPATAAPLVFTDCGPMPPKVITCLDTLGDRPSDAEVVRCYMLTVNEQDAEIDSLRAQFSACAKGTPKAAPLDKCGFFDFACKRARKVTP